MNVKQLNRYIQPLPNRVLQSFARNNQITLSDAQIIALKKQLQLSATNNESFESFQAAASKIIDAKTLWKLLKLMKRFT